MLLSIPNIHNYFRLKILCTYANFSIMLAIHILTNSFYTFNSSEQSMSVTKITSKQLMSVFADMDAEGSDQRACFIIGAGASKQSGIPTGGELALRWWNELLENKIYSLEEIKAWLAEAEPTTARVKKSDLLEKWQVKTKLETFDVAPYYSRIYQYRFAFNPDGGYEALSNAMRAKQPSYGYSVLAKALCKQQHNVVITTNFDNLLEYSLHIYTNSHPLMCGHEALASFARHSNNRPLIAKIHRDLFLKPMNEEKELELLKEAWVKPLEALLADRKVFVIGYGGNDGSLMGLLSEIPLHKKLYWCTYGNHKPQPEVMELLKTKEGYLVETEGFDELMFLLRGALNIPRMDEEIEQVAMKRANDYRETEKNILEKSSMSDKPEVKEAVQERMQEAHEEKDDWSYILLSRGIKNITEKIKFLEDGIVLFPKSSFLFNELAYLMQFELKSKDPKIETYYLKAITNYPNNYVAHGNYAVYLQEIKNDNERAEKHYLTALRLDPANAIFNSNYAEFLHKIKHDSLEIEKYFKRAITSDPENANILGSYANFLYEHKNDEVKAEKYYLQALAIDPEHANNNANYGVFLSANNREPLLIEKYFMKALEKDPLNPKWINQCVAMLLSKLHSTDKNESEHILSKALDYSMRAYSLNQEMSNYNLACVYAKMGDSHNALRYLEENLNGLTKQTLKHIENDKDLDQLREDKNFKALMRKYFKDEYKG